MGSSQHILDYLKQHAVVMPLGSTGSPSTTLEISIDIREDFSLRRVLGQMVYVVLREDGRDVLVIGQVVSVETINKWHEDPAFKGVIKRHGKLPHLSEQADNRIAKISVQASYDLSTLDPEGYILGNSPSTGLDVEVLTNEVMDDLMAPYKDSITYLGKFYNTDVHAPFWFKHFDKDDLENREAGAGDAYHIGVFGKTGSGKSNTAATMLLGYAKNSHNMNIMILDPQAQFYNDRELLPGDESFADAIKKAGMTYTKLNILRDVYLPAETGELFGEMLVGTQFIQQAFGKFYTDEKIEEARDGVISYIVNRLKSASFSLETVDADTLLREMLAHFAQKTVGEGRGGEPEWSKFVTSVYGTRTTRDRLQTQVDAVHRGLASLPNVVNSWKRALQFFQKFDGDRQKVSIDRLVAGMIEGKGNVVVLNLLDNTANDLSENIQAVFVNEIEKRIVESGASLYGKRRANCLIVLDEAHRFISYDNADPRIHELTREIIGSVRTTRKYGIGYMFITQTIDSMDDEIINQMRVFAFGYGLTSGNELKKISNIINNQHAIRLYQSFIDPSSNHKYPFMFYGPISPLSFTGSPLFVNMYTGSEGLDRLS